MGRKTPSVTFLWYHYTMSKPIPFSLDHAASANLSDQLADGLRDAIVSGYYRKGDILPTIVQLAKMLGTSVQVPRTAIAALAAENFVSTRRGVGCIVVGRRQPTVEGGVRAMVAGARGKLGASGVPFEVRLVDDFLENPDLVKHYRAALLAGFLFRDESRKALMARFAEAGVRTLVERADGIEAEEFNAFAREAGAFVAADPGTEVDMNGDFKSLHALSPDRRRISLPFPARVVNVRSGLEESADPDGFNVEMSAGETCWFRLFRIGPEPESTSSAPAADTARATAAARAGKFNY